MQVMTAQVLFGLEKLLFVKSRLKEKHSVFKSDVAFALVIMLISYHTANKKLTVQQLIDLVPFSAIAARVKLAALVGSRLVTLERTGDDGRCKVCIPSAILLAEFASLNFLSPDFLSPATRTKRMVSSVSVTRLAGRN
jgi:hypothetical protein